MLCSCVDSYLPLTCPAREDVLCAYPAYAASRVAAGGLQVTAQHCADFLPLLQELAVRHLRWSIRPEHAATSWLSVKLAQHEGKPLEGRHLKDSPVHFAVSFNKHHFASPGGTAGNSPLSQRHIAPWVGWQAAGVP